MKIKTIHTTAGESLHAEKFIVLVGPNNSGKSQTLKDIQTLMYSGPTERIVLVKSIDLEKPTHFNELLQGLKISKNLGRPGESNIMSIGTRLIGNESLPVNLSEKEAEFEQASNANFILGNLSRFHVTYLDVQSRLNIAQTHLAKNPHDEKTINPLDALYKDTSGAMDELKAIFRQAFNMDVEFDYSGLTEYCFRLADQFPQIPENPKKAFPIMGKYEKLDVQGDGFKSFVAVVLSLLIVKGRITLIDEPGAFLHPPQARLLGRWIVEYSNAISSQVIVATHNSNILSGILSSSHNVQILRLNRTANTTTYHQMSPESTSKLAKSPLLSNQRILEAVFYKGVVVCEADADRCIYRTVSTKEFKNQNILFVHTHNKQTLKAAVYLLRDASIPVCAIADIDILNSEAEFTNLLKALGIDNVFELTDCVKMQKHIFSFVESKSEAATLYGLKAEISKFLEQLNRNEHSLDNAKGALNRIRRGILKWDEIKKKGIELFPENEQKAIQKFLENLGVKGLFIVPVGELESWMNLGTTRKNKWIVLALEALHNGKCGSELRRFIGQILQFFGEIVD